MIKLQTKFKSMQNQFSFDLEGREDMQDFVVMGVQQGISQQGYKETITDELILRGVDKGFNDPRRNTQTDYDGTNDGLNHPCWGHLILR